MHNSDVRVHANGSRTMHHTRAQSVGTTTAAANSHASVGCDGLVGCVCLLARKALTAVVLSVWLIDVL